MILFKRCPRCGGDVDAADHDDPYCVQCAYRPTLVYPGPRVVARRACAPVDGRAPTEGDEMCPKCGSRRMLPLDKLRPADNTCYRCRACGHIFSPGQGSLGAAAPS